MVGLIMIVVFALLLTAVDKSSTKKATRYAEQKQKEMYAWIDERFDGAEALEYKADVDAIITYGLKEKGHDYNPENIKQVTSKQSHKEMAHELAVKDNFEFFVKQTMKFGYSREKAEEIVRKQFERDGVM